MFKQLAFRTPQSENEPKQAKRQRKMLEDCQKVIMELQSQLQYALKQNQQKDQIIKILTEEKQFYQLESRKSDQKFYPKIKEQLSFNQSLVNALKQYNKQLTEKNIILQQQNKSLWQKCQEKDQLLKITQQNITQLQQEKSKLERQWGQTLKSVKNKIFEIRQQSDKNCKVLLQKQNIKKRALSRGGQKKNFNSKEQKTKYSTNISNLGCQNSKVQEILRQIDKKLLNFQFEDLIQSKQLKKELRCNEDYQSNKQNISNYINVPKMTEKLQSHAKKVPILKLSELQSRQCP